MDALHVDLVVQFPGIDCRVRDAAGLILLGQHVHPGLLDQRQVGVASDHDVGVEPDGPVHRDVRGFDDALEPHTDREERGVGRQGARPLSEVTRPTVELTQGDAGGQTTRWQRRGRRRCARRRGRASGGGRRPGLSTSTRCGRRRTRRRTGRRRGRGWSFPGTRATSIRGGTTAVGARTVLGPFKASTTAERCWGRSIRGQWGQKRQDSETWCDQAAAPKMTGGQFHIEGASLFVAGRFSCGQIREGPTGRRLLQQLGPVAGSLCGQPGFPGTASLPDSYTSVKRWRRAVPTPQPHPRNTTRAGKRRISRSHRGSSSYTTRSAGPPSTRPGTPSHSRARHDPAARARHDARGRSGTAVGSRRRPGRE